MKKITLIYWPEGGNVENVADKFITRFEKGSVIKMSLGNLDKKMLHDSDHWLVGGSTVGSHVWEDANDSNKWYEFFQLLDEMDMTKKTVAFFGLGDHILYPNHFVDGLGILEEEFRNRNANIVGHTPVKDYEFNDSDGMKNGMFFGLALDQDNDEEQTDNRIDEWLKTVKPQLT